MVTFIKMLIIDVNFANEAVKNTLFGEDNLVT